MSLAIYDAAVSPHTYTGSENNDMTDNQISLNSPLEINDEVILNPRNYDGAVFEMSPGTDYFSTKHSSWWSTNRTISFANESMYIPWGLPDSKYV